MVKAYKITDRNGQCRGHQFEEGNSYHQDGIIKPCENGFHACENPRHCQDFYGLYNSRFFEVECSGTIIREGNKLACSQIDIIRELNLKEWASVCFDYLMASIKDATTGYRAHSATTGDGAIAFAPGYMSRASVKSKKSWIVISRWESGEIAEVFARKPGQKIGNVLIETNTWYWFEDGQLKSERM